MLPHGRTLSASRWACCCWQTAALWKACSQRNPKLWPLAVGRKIATWWDFYCGILLSIPLFLPGLFQRGRVRIFQIIFLGGVGVLPLAFDNAIAWRILIDGLLLLEIAVLWF